MTTRAAPHILELFDPSEYISAFELNEQDHTVTIARVVGGVIEGDAGRKSKKPVVTFTDWPKPMVLNKTNTKVLVKLFGTYDYTKWAGKRFTIYPTTAKFGTETVDAIRIRKTAPPPAAPKQAERPARTVAERVMDALAAFRSASSAEQLKKRYGATEALRGEVEQPVREEIDQLYEARLMELEAPA